MNGFQKHNIDHVSASSINTWAAAPCFWVAKYIYGHKGEFGHAARAGVLVEQAVVNVLARGFTAQAAIDSAVAEYAKATALGCTDADRKRGEGIPDMISLALEALKPYGTPEFEADGKQKKVELTCKGDGWEIPVIGYLDLDYPAHGLTIDLKTTMRMPSEMSDAHLRQKAIYQKHAQNKAVKFLYVTPKKSQMFDTADATPALQEIKTILTRQEAFLRALDRETMIKVVPVNKESYYWNGNEALRQQLFGY